MKCGVPYGSRTRVAAVKGRCPRPLDERDARGGLNKLTYKFGECQTCYKQSISHEKAQKSQEEIGYQSHKRNYDKRKLRNCPVLSFVPFVPSCGYSFPGIQGTAISTCTGTHAKGEYSRGQEKAQKSQEEIGYQSHKRNYDKRKLRICPVLSFMP